MNKNDIIKIKNNAGVLKIKIIKNLCGNNVSVCVGEDRLPSMEKPRLEYHTDGYRDVVTLYSGVDEKLKRDIYIGLIENNEIEYFKGEIIEFESENKELLLETKY